MSDPPRDDAPKDNRIQLLLSAKDLEAIDDWRFKNRIPSRNEAIRQLIRIGIAYSPN